VGETCGGARRDGRGRPVAPVTPSWPILIVLAAAVLAAVAATACGGATVAADDPLVGFWLGGGSADQMTMIQVGRSGSDYIVLADPDAPAGDAVKKGDSLVIESHAVTMTLQPAGADELALTFSGEMFATPHSVVLRRVTRTRYADASVAQGIAVLRRGLAMWKAGGAETYPPADEVAADGLLAQMVRWPSNPFTGGPMGTGTGPGEYTYKLLDGGRKYALTGHLSDGRTVGD